MNPWPPLAISITVILIQPLASEDMVGIVCRFQQKKLIIISQTVCKFTNSLTTNTVTLLLTTVLVWQWYLAVSRRSPFPVSSSTCAVRRRADIRRDAISVMPPCTRSFPLSCWVVSLQTDSHNITQCLNQLRVETAIHQGPMADV